MKIKFRPRYSLLTLLLVATIVAQGVTVWRQSYEVLPLRQELQLLRRELGHLTINDPNKVHAIAVQTLEPKIWKWRIYVPPGRRFSCYIYDGTIPSNEKYRGDDWIQAVKDNCSGMSTPRTSQGEFTLTARLFKNEKYWKFSFSTNCAGEEYYSSTSLAPSFNEWLSDPRGGMSTGNLPANNQKTYAPDEPILLLHLPKPIITEIPGSGYTNKIPEGPHEGIVLWIEQQPPSQ